VDRRGDPGGRRPRRALTQNEVRNLLTVARTRPLDDARTIRRGKRAAELRPEEVARLTELGRERVLLYRTLLTTGLRLTELRTLTVAQLDLTPGREQLHLEAAYEKNGAGSTLPIRRDLAAALRTWIVDRGLSLADRLFTVPSGLRLILNRDMKLAGIPKRDARGRTVDVHALRTTFGTMLSVTGTADGTICDAALGHQADDGDLHR
jgi:integrase